MEHVNELSKQNSKLEYNLSEHYDPNNNAVSSDNNRPYPVNTLPRSLPYTYTLVRLNKKNHRGIIPNFNVGTSDAEQRLSLRKLVKELFREGSPILFEHTKNAYNTCAMLPEPLKSRIIKLIFRIKPFENLINRREAFKLINNPTAITLESSKKGFNLPFFGSKKVEMTEKNNSQLMLFESLNQLIEELRSIKAQVEKINITLAGHLQAIIDHYTEEQTKFCHANPDQQRIILQGTPLLYGFGTGEYLPTYELKKEIVDKILPVDEQGELKKINREGTHVVSQVGGIHFKVEPDAPGIEFAIDALNKTIARQGSTPSALYRIYYQGHGYLVLASKTASGKMLSELLSNHPDFIYAIDPNNFSANIALSLAGIKPQDAKSPNYIGSYEYGSRGELKPIEITNIDGDMAFSTGICIKSNGRHTIEIKDILYFFPQMKQPVGQDFRLYLASQSSALILLDWLRALMLQNQAYQTMLEQNILTPEDMQRLGLPIQFRPGTLSTIYHDLTMLITMCQSTDQLTNEDLFKAINPTLYAIYRVCQQQFDDTIESIEKAYGLLSTIDIEDLIQMSQDPILSAIDLSLYTDHPNDFLKRTQSVEDALEELMSVVNFKKLSIEHQREIINRLLQLNSVSELHLNNCDALDDTLLKYISENGKELTQIALKNCPHITEIGLANLALYKPQLAVTVSRTEKLANTSWPKYADEFSQFTLLLADGFSICMKKGDAKELDATLVLAAQAGSHAGIEFLLSLGANPSATDVQNFSALYYAAQGGYILSVQFLLTAGAAVNYQEPIQYSTALHEAVTGNHHEVTELLLAAGADLTLTNVDEETALHLAAHWADHALMITLIEHIKPEQLAGIFAKEDKRNKRIIHHAASNPDSQVLAYCLTLDNNSINAQDHLNNTPLHIAAREGHLEQVQQLIRAGAAPTLMTKGKLTALRIAINNGHLEIVDYLEQYQLISDDSILAKGAVKMLRFSDDTALHTAILAEDFDKLAICIENLPHFAKAGNARGDTPLHLASQGPDSNPEYYQNLTEGSKERKRLEEQYILAMNRLLKAGADINAQNDLGETPLHLAVRVSRSITIVQWLLDHNADIKAVDMQGNTVLHEAVRATKNQYALVKFLMENGAKELVKAGNANSIYPLHLVLNPSKTAYTDQQRTFNYLVKNIISKDKALASKFSSSLDYQVNAARETLLHWAVERLDVGMVKTLLKYMRKINASSMKGDTALHVAITRLQTLLNDIQVLANQYSLALLTPQDDVKTSILFKELLRRQDLADNAKEIIKQLIKAGAWVKIRNNQSQTPLSLAQSIPVIRPLCEAVAKRERELSLNIRQDLKMFMQNQEMFKKVYEQKLLFNPKHGFSSEIYAELYNRYRKIYEMLENGHMVSISDATLLADAQFAQSQMQSVYEDSDKNLSLDKADAHKYHGEFFNQIVKAISDYELLQRNFTEYLAYYSEHNLSIKQEVFNAITKTISEYQSVDQDKQFKVNTIELLKAIQSLINNLQFREYYYKTYKPEFDYLIENLPIDIQALHNAIVIDKSLQEKIDYYLQMNNWLLELSKVIIEPTLSVAEQQITIQLNYYTDLLTRIRIEFLEDEVLKTHVANYSEEPDSIYFNELAKLVTPQLAYLQNSNTINTDYFEQLQGYDEALNWLEDFKTRVESQVRPKF